MRTSQNDKTVFAKQSQTAAIAVAAASTAIDLSASLPAIMWEQISNGAKFTLAADTGAAAPAPIHLLYFFDTVTGTIVPGASTTQAGDAIPGGTSQTAKLPVKVILGNLVACNWLMTFGSAAGVVRISIGEEPSGLRTR